MENPSENIFESIQTQNAKRIVIRVSGSHALGMGHVFRMLALAKDLQSKNLIIHFVFQGDEVGLEMIKKSDFSYDFFPIHYPQEAILKETAKENTSCFWILDILDTEMSWIHTLKDLGNTVVCFDDRKGILNGADFVINSITGCWEAHTTQVPNLLSGPDYAILPEYILGYRRKRTIDSASIPLKIGITLGGSDTHGVTVKIAEMLNGSKLMIDCVHFFTGPCFGHSHNLNNILKKCDYTFRVHEFVSDLHGLLNQMNVVICGGGITLFEVCSMGLPAISIANEAHEVNTIFYFEKRNACFYIGTAHDVCDNDNRIRLINILSNSEHLTSLSQNGMNIVDGKGLYRIGRFIDNIANHDSRLNKTRMRVKETIQ